MSPSRPHPAVMITQTAHNSHLHHYRCFQQGVFHAMAVELSYYLDHLYTTEPTNYATTPITISYRALYCDATTQTITSPSPITHSTQTPLHLWNYCYA